MRHALRAAIGVVALTLTGGASAEARGALDYVAPQGLPVLPVTDGARVTVTWYGVTTLLFDDGETKILIDGFFSRAQFESLDDLAAPDKDHIAAMVQSAQLTGLAAITPVHSHFDHAMDLGEVALATGAVVLGSPSTANIARGAGVPEERIRLAENTLTATFGAFKVDLIRSAHAPLVDGGPPIPGTIDAPIMPPARIGDWKEGGSYTIVLAHPAGTALVQGSAGYVEGRLDGVTADVVFLGTGGLATLGREHASAYHAEIVAATGTECVVPIHWDDFTRPFGEVIFGGDEREMAWLREFAAESGAGGNLAVLPFAQPVDAFANDCVAGGGP
ncbi:MAG: MBL fold metallo-hydrolase [Gammaproteobacteria bacterium]|nr:MBL fold metallo-hydrolase [Gammaproteobacteria bacterium]